MISGILVGMLLGLIAGSGIVLLNTSSKGFVGMEITSDILKESDKISAYRTLLNIINERIANNPIDHQEVDDLVNKKIIDSNAANILKSSTPYYKLKSHEKKTLLDLRSRIKDVIDEMDAITDTMQKKLMDHIAERKN